MSGGTASTLSDAFSSASIEVLKKRADLLSRLRRFFAERGYWEVDTPSLSHDVVVDAHLDPLTASVPIQGRDGSLYLQTSPEFAMKRLLASGSGDIYQITRAFRGGESGRLHNPEFTIIEWYRVDASYHELMTEIGDLVVDVVGWPAPDRISYQQAFQSFADMDPFETSDDELCARCAKLGLAGRGDGRDDWLNYLLATLVEPRLGVERPAFLFDYPPSQAALSKVAPGPPAVAQRFELYYRGIELCNGYQELTDPRELVRRANEQNQVRQSQQKPVLPVTSRLLTAMQAGLPEAAGVAMGFDRLLMLSVGAGSLGEVLAFPYDRA